MTPAAPIEAEGAMIERNFLRRIIVVWRAHENSREM
jgi:hypothetical protein